MFGEAATAMQRVALMKKWSAEYVAECEARGWEAVFAEPLEFAWAEEDALRAALAERWHALCVTSVRAVQAVARAWPAPPHRPRTVYAVGAATARAVRDLLGTEARGQAGSGAALGEQMATELGGGARVLWARGQLAGDALSSECSARGLRVHAVTVYETCAHAGLEERLRALAAEAAAGRLHALALFSPSGAELVLEGPSGAVLRTLPLFSIGPTTAEAMASLQAPAAGVAGEPSAKALLQVIDKYFTAKHCPTDVKE